MRLILECIRLQAEAFRPLMGRFAIVLCSAAFLLIGTGGHWMAWLGSIGFVAGMMSAAYMQSGSLSLRKLSKRDRENDNAD